MARPTKYNKEETVKFSVLPAYAVLNIQHSAPIAYEKLSLRRRISNAVYRFVDFWGPIVVIIAVYIAAMKGLHWAIYGG